MTRREALIEYLKSCIEVGDWHGVADAANDLRVEEARQQAMLQSSTTYPTEEPLK